MPRAATTRDVFNAIAEPRRRQIVDILARRGAGGLTGRGLAVALVAAIGLSQPAVSKHLGVLRKVGIVTVSKHGQQRLYRLEAAELKAVHDWVRQYERFWSHQLDRIKVRAERGARQRASLATQHPPEKGRT